MADEDPVKGRNGAATKGKSGSSGKLNREIQAQLGDQLRQMYNDVVGQGVPDKFVDLLSKLDKAGGGDSEESPK
jgi:hypothetical protein